MKPARAMVVAGVMSGTSADGVDVAIVRVAGASDGLPRVKVLHHQGMRYPAGVRRAVLQAMNAEAISVAELSRLNWRLGEVYADAVMQASAAAGVKPALIGMHGQTIYHQGKAERYLGRPTAATWQTGEAAVVRERCGVPVVSDLRAADVAAGGQGAPMVPMLDYCAFRSERVHRLLLNLGGIANVTVIPAGSRLEDVIAFDTGPANMVIDALMERRFSRGYDRGGQTAARGRVDAGVVAKAMRERYLRALPPKSCGREQFGEAFVERFSRWCGLAGLSAEDEIATAAAFTVAAIDDAVKRFCLPRFTDSSGKIELIAAGGGVRNAFVMDRLRQTLAAAGVRMRTLDELGMKSEAKEAAAFALLAWLSWHGLVGSLPGVTGARGARVLGKVTC